MHTSTAVCWGQPDGLSPLGIPQAPGSITACQLPLGFAGPCREIWLLRRAPTTDTHLIHLHFGAIHLKIHFLVLLCVPKECGGPVSEAAGSEMQSRAQREQLWLCHEQLVPPGLAAEGQEKPQPGWHKCELLWSLTLEPCFLVSNHKGAMNHSGLSLLAQLFPFHFNSSIFSHVVQLHPLSTSPCIQTNLLCHFLTFCFVIPLIPMCCYSTCSRLNKSLLDKDGALPLQ